MHRRRKPQRKRITPQQITGPLGVNLVENIILRMGFPWHPTRQELEGGIDGFIEIRDPSTGYLTNSILKVQVKTTTCKWANESNAEFSLHCDERDIDYWMSGDDIPVVLIAVRPDGKEAYWANVRQVFSDPQRRKDQCIRFDKKTQRFDGSAARTLIEMAVPKDPGIHMPAVAQDEKLISNLLEVRSFPPTIYVAATVYRDPKEIFQWEEERSIQLPSGWLLTEKSIRSIYDLREQPWVDLVDRGSVECFATDEWSDSDDLERRREFVRLMNQVLREDMRNRHLLRSRDENCFYFPARRDNEKNLLPQQYDYQSLQQNTSREVAYIHYHPETKEFVYCRHNAMKCTFMRVDGRWFLAITPHYVYTTDGKTPYPYGEELLSGMKRIERQEAVLGQVVMWARKLTQPPKLFDYVDKKPLITFGDLLTASCNRGVDDNEWLRTDTTLTDADDDDDSSDWELF